MIELFGDAGSWIAVGGVLILLGYLVRSREWTFLIAGYDASADVPQSVAASVVGNFLLRVGMAAAILGVVTSFTTGLGFGYLFAVLVVLDLVRVLYRLNTYEGGDPGPQ